MPSLDSLLYKRAVSNTISISSVLFIYLFFFFTRTCHGVKQLVGLQVSEGGEAAWAPERGTVGGVSFICFYPSSHVIQFIFDHIDQDPLQKSGW